MKNLILKLLKNKKVELKYKTQSKKIDEINDKLNHLDDLLIEMQKITEILQRMMYSGATKYKE